MNRLEELKIVELGEKIGYKKGFEDARKQFERPHGEWVAVKQYNRKRKRFLDCSVCHYGKEGEIVCEVTKIPNFCPNCGSDNRPKEDEAK